MKYLLNTNVFREIGKTEPHENVTAWLKSVDDVDLAISAMTVREVAKGIENLRKKKPDAANDIEKRVNAAYDAFGDRILAIDRFASEDWGKMLAASDRHIDDTCIAAIARTRNLILVTRNIKDFLDRGVKLLNPFKSPPESIP